MRKTAHKKNKSEVGHFCKKKVEKIIKTIPNINRPYVID